MDGNGRGKDSRPMRTGTRDARPDIRPLSAGNARGDVNIIKGRTPSPRRPLAVLTRGHLVSVAAKRVVDIVLAAAGLALLTPLLACIAVMIRLDSAGPALYPQRRVGRGGAAFTM